MTKEDLLLEIAHYTQVLHDAMEQEKEFDNRPHHLGHLAMAARMFKILHLGQPVSDLEQIYRIKSKAFTFVKLPSPSAAATRDAWQRLAPSLQQLIEGNIS